MMKGIRRVNAVIKKVLARILILAVRFYQICISPFFPPTCRYIPTCSVYFIQAVEKYGPFKGSYLGIRRILRCHPGHPGGFDPVP